MFLLKQTNISCQRFCHNATTQLKFQNNDRNLAFFKTFMLIKKNTLCMRNRSADFQVQACIETKKKS